MRPVEGKLNWTLAGIQKEFEAYSSALYYSIQASQEKSFETTSTSLIVGRVPYLV